MGQPFRPNLSKTRNLKANRYGERNARRSVRARCWNATVRFSTWPNQIFWLAVTLIVIYMVLSRVALPRIGAVLAERNGVITNDLAAAEDFKQKAVLADQAYNDALDAARIEAAKIITEAKAAIQKDLDKAIAKADTEIAAKATESEKEIAVIRDSAVKSVTEVATATAGEIVMALGGVADAKAVKSAVAARMKG